MKITKKDHPPRSKRKPEHRGPVSSMDKQSMRYVIVKNIESDTSYLEKDWPVFLLKELKDNAYDWMNDYYPAKSPKDKEVRKVTVRIWISTDSNNNRFVHIAVRNSNVNNFQIFEELDKTFDFDNWDSTKRNQYRMTCGSLGDALKRCLGMGYASWTSDINFDETFEDKEWNEPLIIRCNGKEHKIFIKVNWALQKIWAQIQKQDKLSRDIGNDTEVEVTLPLRENISDKEELLPRLKRYCQIYRIGKPNTIFSLDCANHEGEHADRQSQAQNQEAATQ